MLLLLFIALAVAVEIPKFDGACREGAYESITIGAVGDILPHNKVQIAAYKEGSFIKLMEVTLPLLQKPDVLYGNLECTVAGPINARGKPVDDVTNSGTEDKPKYSPDDAGGAYTGYPYFNAHKMLVKNLKEVGFDVVSTANNHALDRRQIGVDKTIDHLREVGLQYTGTRHSGDVDPKYYTVVNGKGKDGSSWKIAFLSCTFSTNGNVNGKEQVLMCFKNGALTGRMNPLVSCLLKELNARSDIDAIVVTPHWGRTEKKLTVDKSEKVAGRAFIDAGATVVFGTHVHVPQPCENYKNKLICYSSGNFLSKYRGIPTGISMFFMVSLRRIKHTREVVTDGFQFHPFEQKGAYLRPVQENGWPFVHKTFGRERLLPAGEDKDIVDHKASCSAFSKLSVKRTIGAKPAKCEICIGNKKLLKEGQELLQVPADGIWGRGSNGALNAFQNLKKLPLTQCLTQTALKQLRKQ